MKLVLQLTAEGYTHRDVAMALGISEGTSKSQFSKGKNEGEQLMNDFPREGDPAR